MSAAAYRDGFVEESGPLDFQPMVTVAASVIDGVYVSCAYPCDRCGAVKALHPDEPVCASCRGDYRPLTRHGNRVE